MAGHKRSDIFKDDAFVMTILFESSDRSAVELMEEKYIEEYDTFNSGLNETKSGKGFGHNSPKFTTLGFEYSDESKSRMSSSAKERAIREGSEIRSEISRKGWENGGEAYRKHQSDIRKGKRLCPVKLSDDSVDIIRERFSLEVQEFRDEALLINKERTIKNAGWCHTNEFVLFAKKYADEFGVSEALIKNIVKGKMRTKRLPKYV
tara:strand:- start:743 stop:1360 length:618 start_codon:yes stop_codon:yes gene_type:complete